MKRVCAGILLAALLALGATRPAVQTAAPAAAIGDIASARQAVRQSIATLGENHPVTAFMLCNLALAMRQAGYLNYAEHYARQSLAILEHRFGPDDVSLVPSLNVLAEAAILQGKVAEGREFALRAVAIGPDAGAHYGTALHNLGAASQADGDFWNAAKFYNQALSVRERLLPAGHPYIAMSRNALSQAQRSAKAIAHR
jgi:tetratricopeptide (TPR) repeat protein